MAEPLTRSDTIRRTVDRDMRRLTSALQEAIQRQGWTVVGLEQRLGLSPGDLARELDGDLAVTTIFRVLEALEIPPESFLPQIFR